MKRPTIEFTGLLIAALATAFLCSRVAGQAFTNGSFELPGGLPADNSIILTNGDTRLIGWTISGNVTYNNGNAIFGGITLPSSADGSYQLSFNGPDSGSISQTFDTVAGEQYEVSFHFGRLGLIAGPVNFIVRFFDGSSGDLGGSQYFVPSANGYRVVQTFRFTAASSRSRLQFLGADVLLDDVSIVHSTYEPYTFTTLAGGGGFNSPDMPGTAARFWIPAGVAVDRGVNIYVSDVFDH